MSYLFLAEKPSTMKVIKAAYEASNKPIGDIDFMALAGHICKLCEPKEYDDWDVPWKDRPLPMIPSDFKVGPLRPDVIKKVKDALKAKKYDAIIVGTDSDVEGNGIYDLVEKYCGLEKYKAYRFFESDLTPVGIMRSMQNLQDYHTNPRDVGMTQAYRIRSRFDWLVGFNMSVAYTVKSGFLMKVGRVKAPTLKLVYDNCKAIDNFKSSTMYQPHIVTGSKVVDAGMVDDDRKAVTYQTKAEADDVINSLSGKAKVKSFEKTVKKTAPNQLYKLTDIQYEAGQKFGYTPEKTLELIQSLYETHKMISYPRTDGRYVSSEKAKDFRHLLKAVESFPGLGDIAKSITNKAIVDVQNNSRYVNDKKVQESSHDALLPTGDVSALKNLNADEYNICGMIFRRFLAIFLPSLEEEKVKLILDDAGKMFLCNGSKIVNPGFTIASYNNPSENIIPDMAVGEMLTEKEKYVRVVVSKPPQRFTQATLIKAMENIQKYVDEDDLKKVMKKAGGIGQPSSRAAIISELVSSGYVEDKTKGAERGLHMTPAGNQYIENLGESSIVNPKLSAEWEVHMNDIRDGSETYDDVYEQIISYVKEALDELDKMDIKKVQRTVKDRKQVGECPLCGKPVVEYQKAYGCSRYPDCKMIIPKTIAGKNLTEKNVKDLLTNGRTDRISGFKSKAGKTFAACLEMCDGKVQWEQFEKPTDFKCPKCGKNIIKSPMLYKCEDSECGFTLWREMCGKVLKDEHVKDLLEGRGTELIKGFKSKAGKEFDAHLKIIDGKLGFQFDSGKDTGMKCPVCGSPIVETDKAFSCSHENNKECRFVLFKKLLYSGWQTDITKTIAKELIEKGKTKKKYKIIAKNGNEYEAYMILDENNKVKEAVV